MSHRGMAAKKSIRSRDSEKPARLRLYTHPHARCDLLFLYSFALLEAGASGQCDDERDTCLLEWRISFFCFRERGTHQRASRRKSLKVLYWQEF